MVNLSFYAWENKDQPAKYICKCFQQSDRFPPFSSPSPISPYLPQGGILPRGLKPKLYPVPARDISAKPREKRVPALSGGFPLP